VTKYLRKSASKKEKFIFALGFKGFSLWSAGSISFKPEARQKHQGRRA
jgi:hypothetical protein